MVHSAFTTCSDGAGGFMEMLRGKLENIFLKCFITVFCFVKALTRLFFPFAAQRKRFFQKVSLPGNLLPILCYLSFFRHNDGICKKVSVMLHRRFNLVIVFTMW